MIILLVLVFIRKELIVICVRLGNVFKALFASGVFGNDSLQSADVDCEDCIWIVTLYLEWWVAKLLAAWQPGCEKMERD